jgi:MFS family permease
MGFKAGTVAWTSRAFCGSIPDRQPAVVRTLCLASLAGALEFYDFFFFFAFFVPVIGRLFFSVGLADWVRQPQTFGIFAVGYFARPLGGIVMAHFGDVRGPKANIYSKRFADGDPYHY